MKCIDSLIDAAGATPRWPNWQLCGERVRRFKEVGKTLSKLFSANLEKALTFLDDKLLPSTSNAVERGYRRHRKMQKSIYRVRTFARLVARIAIDMLRDAQALGRTITTQTLHHARAG